MLFKIFNQGSKVRSYDFPSSRLGESSQAKGPATLKELSLAPNWSPTGCAITEFWYGKTSSGGKVSRLGRTGKVISVPLNGTPVEDYADYVPTSGVEEI